jgi:hypothetical protein
MHDHSDSFFNCVKYSVAAELFPENHSIDSKTSQDLSRASKTDFRPREAPMHARTVGPHKHPRASGSATHTLGPQFRSVLLGRALAGVQARSGGWHQQDTHEDSFWTMPNLVGTRRRLSLVVVTLLALAAAPAAGVDDDAPVRMCNYS